jgi:hypothetical protein
MRLDSRRFSKEAYEGLIALRNGDPTKKRDYQLEQDYYKKASGLIQGLPAYISTWGLHRLSGDATKFLKGTAEDTKYKGKESSLVNLPLRHYTALNHLAIQLAKEWSFWSASILGEAETD